MHLVLLPGLYLQVFERVIREQSESFCTLLLLPAGGVVRSKVILSLPCLLAPGLHQLQESGVCNKLTLHPS